MALLPGAIGIRVPLPEGLELAAKYGFAGYHLDILKAAELGAARVHELAAAAGVKLAAFGFPVEFRRDEATYQNDLKALPRLAAVAADLGIARSSTWIMPFSNELDYADNMTFHSQRLQPAAAILDAHGIRLGLEYVGPKTKRDEGRYPFIHTLEGMLELAHAVGPNAGLLLDSFHWFTAHETVEVLQRLDNEHVVEVHVNDALDLPPDEQLDHQRTLPGATGVIDIASFLGALWQFGYDGPVMVEPFSQRLRDLPAEKACAETAASLKRVLSLV